MLSVVSPIFNERDSVEELCRRLTLALAPLGEYEIVLVDDGSTDGSWELLRGIAAGDERVRLLKLSRNFGHQVALTAGLDAARGDAVVLIDADLQDPPELIPDLVARWQEGFDVVYAVRGRRDGESRVRLLAIAAFYRLFRRLAATDIPADTGDFRLLSRRAVDSLARMPERARYLRGMTSWIGFRQVGVTYRRDARFAGSSKYPLAKLLRLASDGIASFSVAPIRLLTRVGFVMIVFCAAVLGWTLYTRFFTHSAPQGWTSVLGVVLLLGGIQLLGMGIVGQYIARIFEETKQRPLYLVEEIVERGETLVSAPATAPTTLVR
ncbi:MAG: polyisoprenyl-phosphate glycosyltransferase [Gaiellaceae bacterium]|nr:polyisoprenyl-phosphate glycosyltransferase [Gaiellaceae bacterium]